mgnify:CR=1 FL=1
MSQYVKNVLVGLSRPNNPATIKQVAAAAVAAAQNPSQAVEQARSLILGCSESYDLAINDNFGSAIPTATHQNATPYQATRFSQNIELNLNQPVFKL